MNNCFLRNFPKRIVRVKFCNLPSVSEWPDKTSHPSLTHPLSHETHLAKLISRKNLNGSNILKFPLCVFKSSWIFCQRENHNCIWQVLKPLVSLKVTRISLNQSECKIWDFLSVSSLSFVFQLTKVFSSKADSTEFSWLNFFHNQFKTNLTHFKKFQGLSQVFFQSCLLTNFSHGFPMKS